MNLYEIDQSIMSLIDEETGEILNVEAFEQLNMERERKIENLALWHKNLMAEAEAIKKEKLNLAERQKQAENKAESIKNLLLFALNGQKFKTPKVSVSYRKSQSVNVDADFIAWAEKENEDLLTYQEPKPNLAAIKDLLKSGGTVEHAELIEKSNIQIK